MVDKLVNPYIAGAPVTEEKMFFGRDDVFDWIQNSLVGKFTDHILVIHGQRRVGKTSVLKQLGNRLPPKYIPVFFDLQGRTHTTLDRFLWWLAREMVRVLRQERGIDIPAPDRDAFSTDLEYFETRFLSTLLPMLDNMSLLLTFDEFDNLEESEIRETLARPLIDYLRRMMGMPGLNFIFSIGSSGRKLENMQAAYTDFFKTALYKKISFLNEEQTYKLITRPVEGILEYDEPATNRIYKIVGGHPYFTQLTCHELFARCQRTDQRIIKEVDVEAILDDVVERGTVNLKFVWDEASDMEKWVLSALARIEGKTDSHAIASYLKKQHVRFSESDLTSGLLHLREKDVLADNNQFVIHLLRLWLQKNRPIERVREELTEVNPIANRYIEIGLEFKDKGIYDKAIESFQAALEVAKDNIQAQVSIALVYLEQKAYDKAIVEFEKALTMDDEDISTRAGLCGAHLALGNMAMQKGQLAEAERSYQRVLAINDEHTEARQRMAEIYRQRAEKALTDGRDEDALSAFADAMKYAPEDESLAARLEEVKAEKKTRVIAAQIARSEKEAGARNWEAAIRTLEEASRLAPDDPDIQKRLDEARGKSRENKLAVLKSKAQGLVKAEKYSDALKAWNDYLSLEPENRERVEGEIAKLQKLQELEDIYGKALTALSHKDHGQAVNLLKEIIVRDENFKDSSRLLAQAIELRRASGPSKFAGAFSTILKVVFALIVIGGLGTGGYYAWKQWGNNLFASNNRLDQVQEEITGTPKTSSDQNTPEPRVINPDLYIYINRTATWHEAKDYCASLGGHLATIQDAEENEFINKLVGDEQPWLGATDEAEEGTWVWVTGEPWDYTNWTSNQPDNYSGEDPNGEDFLTLGTYGSDVSRWNDASELYSQAFVCEWDTEPLFHTTFDAIQNLEPDYQTSFDAWDFEELPAYASIDTGKLVLTSTGEHVGVGLDIFDSSQLAIEFEFSILDSEPDGHCIFYTDGYSDQEIHRSTTSGFHNSGGINFALSIQQDPQEDFAYSSFDASIPNKYTLVILGDQLAGFINGQLVYAVRDPNGKAIYTVSSFAASHGITCEYDNFKAWDLSNVNSPESTLSPEVPTALDFIKTQPPEYQTNFDSWDFGDPIGNAKIENGKLIVTSENSEQESGISVSNLSSDRYAVEFEFRMLDTIPPEGHCAFVSQNNHNPGGDSWRIIGAGFVSPDQANLGYYAHPDQFPLIVDIKTAFDFSETNMATVIVLGDRITTFINGQIVYSVQNPMGNAVHSVQRLAGSYHIGCEFDNYKIWDLSIASLSESMLSPEIQAGLDFIETQPPAYQTSFDTWEFGDPVENANVENGKLIITSENQITPVVEVNNFTSDHFAVEFEFRNLGSKPNTNSSCNFNTGNDQVAWSAFWKALGAQFNEGGALLARFRYPDLEDFIWENYEGSSVNTVTLLILGDQITAFVNGELIYTVLNPDGSIVFSNHSLGAYTAQEKYVCEFDNYRFWDLSEADSSTTPAQSLPDWAVNFSEPIIAAIADRSPNFQDDFGPGSAGWKEDWCPGNMEYVNEELVFTNCRIYRSNIDWRDFAMEFYIHYVEGTTSSSYFSFQFRDIGNSGHSIRIDQNGDVRIAFANGTTGFNDVSFEGGALPANQTNHLLLIAKGNRFAFYLNGEPFYYTENDVYLYGRCVFYAENPGSDAQAILAMDNFKIWDLNKVTNLP